MDPWPQPSPDPYPDLDTDPKPVEQALAQAAEEAVAPAAKAAIEQAQESFGTYKKGVKRVFKEVYETYETCFADVRSMAPRRARNDEVVLDTTSASNQEKSMGAISKAFLGPMKDRLQLLSYSMGYGPIPMEEDDVLDLHDTEVYKRFKLLTDVYGGSSYKYLNHALRYSDETEYDDFKKVVRKNADRNIGYDEASCMALGLLAFAIPAPFDFRLYRAEIYCDDKKVFWDSGGPLVGFTSGTLSEDTTEYFLRSEETRPCERRLMVLHVKAGTLVIPKILVTSYENEIVIMPRMVATQIRNLGVREYKHQGHTVAVSNFEITRPDRFHEFSTNELTWSATMGTHVIRCMHVKDTVKWDILIDMELTKRFQLTDAAYVSYWTSDRVPGELREWRAFAAVKRTPDAVVLTVDGEYIENAETGQATFLTAPLREAFRPPGTDMVTQSDESRRLETELLRTFERISKIYIEHRKHLGDYVLTDREKQNFFSPGRVIVDKGIYAYRNALRSARGYYLYGETHYAIMDELELLNLLETFEAKLEGVQHCKVTDDTRKKNDRMLRRLRGA